MLLLGTRNTLSDDTIIVHADADWANDASDRKSISGYTIQWKENFLSWSSQKQQTVELSSTEAELFAICEGMKETI